MDEIPRFRVYFKGLDQPPEYYVPLLKPFGPVCIRRDLVGVAYYGGVADLRQAIEDAVDEIRERYPELRMICSEQWKR